MSGGQSGGPLGGHLPKNRFQRRHAQDSQGKWHNMIHGPKFGERYVTEMLPARVKDRAAQAKFREDQRAKREASRRPVTFGSLSPIKPVPNEAHPLFQSNPGEPRQFEYTVCG